MAVFIQCCFWTFETNFLWRAKTCVFRFHGESSQRRQLESMLPPDYLTNCSFVSVGETNVSRAACVVSYLQLLINVSMSIISAVSSLVTTEKLSMIFRTCLPRWDSRTPTYTDGLGASIFEMKSLCLHKRSKVQYWGTLQMTQAKKAAFAWNRGIYFSSWDGIEFHYCFSFSLRTYLFLF